MRTRSTPLDLSETRAVRSLVSGLPKWCGFLGIARELRNMIYIELITSGDVAILRVSRQVHAEAKDVLYKHGICRLGLYSSTSLLTRSLNCFKTLNPPKLPPNYIAKNLNLSMSLHIPLDKHGRIWAGFEEVGPGFIQFIQGSGDCHITLFFPSFSSNHIAPEVFDLIESLNTFKLITVTIHVLHSFHPMDRRIGRLVEPRYPKILQWITSSCSATLGDPEWKSGTTSNCPKFRSPYTEGKLQTTLLPNTPYLEFHPHKARESPAGSSNSVSRVTPSGG